MYKTKVLFSEFVTHDVKRFIVEKPEDYSFIPGQAVSVSVNEIGWKEEKRPFTFTSSNRDIVLEFVIKKYSDHNGVTKKLHEIAPGSELLLSKPFGTIQYKGTGVFIAGGAGITPFIQIIRDLYQQNKIKGHKLIFSNKTKKDIILEKEFLEIFDYNEKNIIFTLTREKANVYKNGRINKQFLEETIGNFKQNFYVCGPPPFIESITSSLSELGAQSNSLILEK